MINNNNITITITVTTIIMIGMDVIVIVDYDMDNIGMGTSPFTSGLGSTSRHRQSSDCSQFLSLHSGGPWLTLFVCGEWERLGAHTTVHRRSRGNSVQSAIGVVEYHGKRAVRQISWQPTMIEYEYLGDTSSPRFMTLSKRGSFFFFFFFFSFAFLLGGHTVQLLWVRKI